MAALARCRPVCSPLAKNPHASIANDNEIENENSPAMVEATLPP